MSWSNEVKPLICLQELVIFTTGMIVWNYCLNKFLINICFEVTSNFPGHIHVVIRLLHWPKWVRSRPVQREHGRLFFELFPPRIHVEPLFSSSRLPPSGLTWCRGGGRCKQQGLTEWSGDGRFALTDSSWPEVILADLWFLFSFRAYFSTLDSSHRLQADPRNYYDQKMYF